MFRIVAGAASVAAFTLFASVARAESPKAKTLGQQNGYPSTRAWLESMDRNRDGVVTRREFDGTDAQFRMLDIDDDGRLTLTRSEPVRGEPVRDDRKFDPRDGNRIDTGRDNDRKFDPRDGNRNDNDRRDMNRDNDRRDTTPVNYNPNGKTIGERHGYASTRDWLATMDRNNDGVITRREFTGSRTEFDILDVNSDGKLTLGRKPARPVAQPVRTGNARSPLR